MTMALTSTDVKRKTPDASKVVAAGPLSPEELDKIEAYWRASLYLCLGMLYLQDNPLLREPLKIEHVKPRMLGQWGSDAGQVFTYVHFKRQRGVA
jgi:xylulose-5-phosphate/fructose-6-phosphate phosphoketolase